VFIDGEKRLTLRGDAIAQEFQVIVEKYIQNRFGATVTEQAN
jgi:(E)-4-hydroxy-3-methylbut-2-enyl-diphosphate synthase